MGNPFFELQGFPKVAGGAASKLAKIKIVRKSVARILTVSPLANFTGRVERAWVKNLHMRSLGIS